MKKFPILEIAIVIAFGVLLYILIWPGYVKNQDMNNKYDVITNMFAMKTAVERNATLDNLGILPDSVDAKMVEYLNDFGIINPFTGEKYTEGDIQFYHLDNTLEIADNMLSGKHGMQRGAPGTFGIGTFQPNRLTYLELSSKEDLSKKDKQVLEDLDMEVTKYVIIGFGKDSMPVTIEDAVSKRIEVYVLNGQKTSID